MWFCLRNRCLGRVNRICGAGVDASAAVDAGVGIDGVLAVFFFDGVDGATCRASAAADAFVADCISHIFHLHIILALFFLYNFFEKLLILYIALVICASMSLGCKNNWGIDNCHDS